MVFTTRIIWKNELENLIALDKAGRSMSEMALDYGVSKQRIKQIFQKFHIEQTCWSSKRALKKEAHHRKWGDRTQDIYEIKRAKWRAKKYNSLRKGIDFDLPFSELHFPTHCPVLGIELNYENENKSENSPSFDREDPTKGYISGNVHIISWRANRIKNDGTLKEHEGIVEYMKSFKSQESTDDTITKQRSFNTVNKE